MTDSLMRRETLEAPVAVERCLAEARRALPDLAHRLRTEPPPFIVLCGRGSSSHAATYLQYVLARRLGLVTAAAMPSVASVYGRAQAMRGALFIAISQSGRSPDIVRQAEDARAAGANCLAIVNAPDSPLARACGHSLAMAAGPEASVAATKTVLTAIAAGLMLVALWSEDAVLAAALDRLPGAIAEATALDWSALTTLLAKVDRLFTTGRGVGLAVAKEAALKLAEVCGIAGLAFSAAEILHGPIALAGPGFPLLAFVQDDEARPGTEAVLRQLVEGRIPVMAASAPGLGGTSLPVPGGIHPDCDLLPRLASFYLAAEAAARLKGRDPDAPPRLSKVTETW